MRVLHLSDVHFRASKAWDADPVLGALTQFIGERVKAEGPPDFVALTGDLAFSGQPGEYDLARSWLDALWPALGNPPKDRLLLVPGNHDVDRGKIDFIAEATQERLLKKGLEPNKSQEQTATVLGNDGQRDILLSRHAAYLTFASDWFGTPQPLPWWRCGIEIDGVRLPVAGLDSAWMASGDEDRGRLLLGRWQIHEMVAAAEAPSTHWRLALLHHPWDYLAEFDHDEVPDLVQRHCDLLLRGHRHKTDPQSVARPDPNRCCIELAAGCVYENSQYPNAFQWIELSPPPKKRLRVGFNLWHEGAGESHLEICGGVAG